MRPTKDDYDPIPFNVALPNPQDFLGVIRESRSGACLLDVFEGRTKTSLF